MKRTARQILEDRREADRRRFKRWKERQEKAGKRHISGMISAQAFQVLNQQRAKSGNSISAVIEKALIGFYGEVPGPEPKPQEPELVPALPHYEDKGYKDYIIDQIKTLKQEGLSFRQIATELESRGLKTLAGKDKWNPGTISKLL